MPTRAFGDYRLKHKEFNRHEFTGSRGYRTELKDYNGPYITHKPEIRVHTIKPCDKFLIMATDGLWDELSIDEVARIATVNKDNPDKLSEKYFFKFSNIRLFKDAMKNVSTRTGITEDDIFQGRFPVRRRNIHDDITILVVNLAEQA